ncbi:hypothetical protein evm_012063 [Chilo suppressalis]|nr:hypothetical protein evm_012063 [Chilo suppressalis]
MIITRTKSAQQRRQLREKDRSMSKITQLLKPQSPKTYKNIKKKSPRTPEKKRRSTETIDRESNNTDQGSGLYKEYYPDKLRRKFEEKRVFLKPKYQSKTVVKLNKRKLETPQRGTLLGGQTQSDDTNTWTCVYEAKSLKFDQLSMEEVVRIVEETESLDDEDLMEILTCPSPVWWEDPPNEKYIEEPIFRRSPVNVQKPTVKTTNKSSEKQTRKAYLKNNSKRAKKTEKLVKAADFITITRTDANFLKKRSKLENLLGNIKNKGFSEPNTKINKDSSSEITEKVNDKSSDSEKVSDKKVKRYSESNESLSDLSFHNEDMLKDLENMDIPMEINSKEKCTENQTELDDKVINAKEDVSCENEFVSHTDNVDVTPIEKYDQDNVSLVPPNLPRLTKRPKLQESPSVKSISDETVISTSSGQENMDTISDTNIRFISDDDIEILGGNNFPQIKEIKSEEDLVDTTDKDIKILDNNNSSQTKKVENETVDNKEVLKALNDKKEFITVYKIVSGEPIGSKLKNIPEYSNYVENLLIEESANEETKCNGQLNNFFKKCKFVNRKKRKELEASRSEAKSSFCDTCEPKKCITVAQEENVKYCLNCSSIFDTDECSYCSVKSKSCVADSGDIGGETSTVPWSGEKIKLLSQSNQKMQPFKPQIPAIFETRTGIKTYRDHFP